VDQERNGSFELPIAHGLKGVWSEVSGALIQRLSLSAAMYQPILLISLALMSSLSRPVFIALEL
jgi:hypothetical protein